MFIMRHHKKTPVYINFDALFNLQILYAYEYIKNNLHIIKIFYRLHAF